MRYMICRKQYFMQYVCRMCSVVDILCGPSKPLCAEESTHACHPELSRHYIRVQVPSNASLRVSEVFCAPYSRTHKPLITPLKRRAREAGAPRVLPLLPPEGRCQAHLPTCPRQPPSARYRASASSQQTIPHPPRPIPVTAAQASSAGWLRRRSSLE